MFARVTTFEIDTLRIDVGQALQRFKELVLPELRKQPGFEGLLVLDTPEGRGLLLSFWESEVSAKAGVESGYYIRQVSKFVMFVKESPGREHYEVVYSEGKPLTASA
jgi:heme-degrading monooxygenase HmoA